MNPAPSESIDARTKALNVLDGMLQKGIKNDLDQLQIASALCVLACQRILANRGIFDRGRRTKLVKWAVDNFAKRLRANAFGGRFLTAEEMKAIINKSETIPAEADGPAPQS